MRKHPGSLPFIPTAAARMFSDGQPIAQRRHSNDTETQTQAAVFAALCTACR
ncbi:hypothetical protein [Neisseria sp.]